MAAVLGLALGCTRVPSTPPVARPDTALPPIADFQWTTDPVAVAALGDRVRRQVAEVGPVWAHDGGIWLLAMPATAAVSVVDRAPSRAGGGGERFTEAAQRVDTPAAVDVVINGMTYSFDIDAHRRGSRQATHARAHGQALTRGTVVGGQALHPTTDRFHLVQHAGRWRVGPGSTALGTGLTGAMALLHGGSPIGSPGGQANRDTDALLSLPSGAGMPYVGVDQDAGLIWILVKQWGRTPHAEASRVADIRAVFQHLGVDDAVALDGGDSVALVVDGHAWVTPAPYKDRSIPFGLRFSWPGDGS